MAAAGLSALARIDGGQLRFRIVQNPHGQLVLAPPDTDAPSGYRPLDGVDCMRVAAAALEGPGVVVENDDGDYVVVVDRDPDSREHIPLDLDDAGLLAAPVPPLARFGRRDDDVIELTPWAPDASPTTLDPDAEAFADVPVVRLEGGEVVVERGDLDADLVPLVRARLAAIDGDTRYGVFTNPFGEVSCVEVGAPVEPHEDVRDQTVIRTSGLAEGAASLAEAAAMLRVYADRLEAADAAGWTLPQPISDDVAFPERA